MKRVDQLVRWGVGLSSISYALIIAALQVVWRTGVVDTWWTELLNVFGLWLYLPLPFATLLAFFARPRLARWMLVVPLLAFGWDYHTMLNWNTPPPAGTPLRVMTWNILWRPHPIEPVAQTIREQRPDIIAIQELGTKQAGQLAPLLAQDYPYSSLLPGESDGLGVWSRYPITETSPRVEGSDGCACQRMNVTVNGTSITLINAHPEAPDYHLRHWRPSRRLPYFPIPVGFSAAHQQNAHRAIAAEGRRATGPVLAVGDFNLNDRQSNYQLLRRSFEDAYREAGQGFGLTFPNAHLPLGRFQIPPLLRIDYIFHTRQFVATTAHTVADPVSDHRAVVADLVLLGDQSTTHTTSAPNAP